jgi:hypothetical protein
MVGSIYFAKVGIMKNNEVYIVGYSLDSCVAARKFAQEGNHVYHVCTGPLGYPHDEIGEFLTEEGRKVLLTYIPGLKLIPVFNSRYLFVPYDSLKMINNKNGLISFPLNKSSFETASELEQMCAVNLDGFVSEIVESQNPSSVIKKHFPKWMYESIGKVMLGNKWGFKQNKLSAGAFIKEFGITYGKDYKKSKMLGLNDTNNGTIYYPSVSYADLCEQFLDHPNISKETRNIEWLQKNINSRIKAKEYIVMDNRIDFACKYMAGKLDRSTMWSETIDPNAAEELIDMGEGVVQTPMKDHWCVSVQGKQVKKIFSKPIVSINTPVLGELADTLANEKTYQEYQEMIQLYSRKHLSLRRLIKTVLI